MCTERKATGLFMLASFLFATMASAAHIKVHFRLDIFMEFNNMNLGQTAPWE